MNKKEILKLKLIELKELCQQLGLDISGNRKSILQERLFEHFNIVDGDSDEEFEEASNDISPSTFTLRDIQDSMNYFDGSGNPEVNLWITEFEDNAKAVQWNDLQRFVYSKQLLRGAAQMFVRSQNNLNNWSKLKQALCDEFGVRLTSADRHGLLRTTKLKPNESLLKLLYRVMEIAKPVEVDEISIVQYFTNAIPDERNNKILMYQATSIAELKSKIKIYEQISTNINKPNQRLKCVKCPNLNNHATEQCKKINGTCFKCGKNGHRAQECKSLTSTNPVNNNRMERNRNNNTQNNNNFLANQVHNNHPSQNSNHYKPGGQNSNNKNYNSYTHRNQNVNPYNNSYANNNKTNSNQYMQTQIAKTNSRLYKEVKIQNVKFTTMIDTGSDVCMITKSIYDQLPNCQLFSQSINIHGIGLGIMKTLGYINANIEIDDAKIAWRLHVANDNDILFQSIIGNDILEVVDINLNSEGAIFSLKNSNHNQISNKTLMTYETNKPGTHFENNQNENFLAETEFKVLCAMEYFDVTDEFSEKFNHMLMNDKMKVINLINNYKPCQTKESPIQMKIVVTDDIPICQRPRRLALCDQKIVENQISEWITAKIIKPSTSQYASPIVLVNKKDGTKRLCIDYRKLNEKIIKDNFPMVLIDDVVAKLQNAKIFTTLDLRNGFFHVPVDAESQKYTAFVTHNGQYEFLRTPFGISNSPATFCRYIATIFKEPIQKGTIIVYMDDIVIPSSNETENIFKLGEVLSVAKEHGLNINWKKCQFLEKEITFLGYKISNSKILPSEDKTKAVKNYPIPRNIKAVQRFLGLTSYFRRFVKNYSIIAKPLSDLLKKDAMFKFGNEQELAFNQLKQALTNPPALSIYNAEAPTEVHTDASKYGYGAVLMQKDSEDQSWHPIEFMSRKTTELEQNYSSYELEVLAIVEALKKWRHYVLGTQFKVITDCIAFTQTIKKQDVPLRVQRWILFFQDFNFTTEHRAGTQLRHVDALSRVHCLMLQSSLKHRIIEAQNKDEYTKTIKELLAKNDHKDFFIKYGILHKDHTQELIVIPADMENEIIKIAHEQGHFGVKKTEDVVMKNFYIKNLTEKTKKVIQNCVRCIVSEAKTGKKDGLLNPINKSDQPFDTYHIDHVGPLEKTKKQYNYILTIIDAFSKFVWLYPTKSTGSEEVVNILNKQATIFGNPKRIISDRGTAFTSNLFKEYCDEENIEHILITTGVPRGNGQVERVHRTVLSLLTKLNYKNPHQWYKNVNKIQQVLNNTKNRSTQFTPFKILTGIEMKVAGLDNIKKLLEEEEIKELHEEIQNVRSTARQNILKIQQENTKNYNKNRKIENDYEIGQLVAIKRTQFGSNLKIQQKYFGPYEILEKKRLGRYKVKKVGEEEGPNITTTVAEYMKPWCSDSGSNH